MLGRETGETTAVTKIDGFSLEIKKVYVLRHDKSRKIIRVWWGEEPDEKEIKAVIDSLAAAA